MIDADVCQEYMEFVYEMSNEAIITKRKYKKIPALLGEFGGMLKLFTTVFVVLSLYYTKAIKSYLFRRVFGIEEPKAKKILKIAEGKLKKEIKKTWKQNNLQQPQLDLAGLSDQSDSISHEKQIKSERVLDSDPKSTFKETLDSKTDIIEAIKKINFVDILNNSCLENYHQILLPLLLLRLEQTEQPEASPLHLTLAFNADQKNREKALNFSDNKEEEVTSPTTKNQEPGKRELETLYGQELYNALKQAKPKNGLEKKLNEEFLSYLWLVYEEEQSGLIARI